MTKYKLNNTIHSVFKKINAKQHVVGWYGIGPNLREKDLVPWLCSQSCLGHNWRPNPRSKEFPTKAYYAVPEFQRREGGTWIGDSADIVLNETMVGDWWQPSTRQNWWVLLEQSSSLKAGKKSFMREMARFRRKLEHFCPYSFPFTQPLLNSRVFSNYITLVINIHNLIYYFYYFM